MGKCGLPPVGSPTKVITGTKKVCRKVFGKTICATVPTTSIVPNTDYLNKVKAYNKCIADEISAAKKRADELAREAAKKGTDAAKKIAEKAKKDAEIIEKAAKVAGKKIKKGLKNLVEKARAAYQKLLRKQALAATYISISKNVHGIATRLYPAITSDSTLRNEKFKLSYKSKASSSYNETLKLWTNLGGKKAKLDEAIRKGAKLRILKTKRTKSGFSGFNSNLSNCHIELQDVSLSRDFSLPFPNNEPKSNCCGYSGADGDGDGYDDESGMPMNSWESADVSEETVTAEDQEALSDEGVEDVSTEEKTSLWQSIIAKILAIFNRNKADENPYDESSADYLTYQADMVEDVPYQPEEDSNSEEAIKEATDKKSSSENSDTVEVFGSEVPKTVLYVGGAIGLGLLIWGGIKLYNKYGK